MRYYCRVKKRVLDESEMSKEDCLGYRSGQSCTALEEMK